jgi:copper(I)-binding protein
MTMNKLDRVKVPVDGKVEFKRGGKHVMVWGVNMVGRRLGEVEAQFLFSNNERILVKARVEEMDGSEPDEKTGKTSAPAKPEAPKADHGEHSGH